MKVKHLGLVVAGALSALAASSEALAMGAAFGLDLATMLDVVNVSTGRNTATSDKFPNRVLTGTYDTGFATRLMAKDVRLFNVFSYITLRAVLACMTALVISFVVGPRMIAWLSRSPVRGPKFIVPRQSGETLRPERPSNR